MECMIVAKARLAPLENAKYFGPRDAFYAKPLLTYLII